MRTLHIASLTFLAVGVVIVLTAPVMAQAPIDSPESATSVAIGVPYAQANRPAAFTTAFNYLVTFYPRWFTYNQVQRFNRLVGPDQISPVYQTVVAVNDGAKAGHAAVLLDYLRHTINESDWITFTNVAEWDKTFQGYLDRSAITEYIQYGNNHNAAVYYHAFLDGNGAPLDGHSPPYILKFPKGRQPEVNRFWSVTAYLPESIELVPNVANKYVVASYTPSLVTAPDGSVTILMSWERPRNFPEANWLPAPRGRFNIMLRAYGPEGSVLDNTYIPPPIEREHGPSFQGSLRPPNKALAAPLIRVEL